MQKDEQVKANTSTFEGLREYCWVNGTIMWNMHCEFEKHLEEKAQKVLKEFREKSSITEEAASAYLHYISVQLTSQARYAFLPRFLSFFEGVMKNICKLSNPEEYKKVDRRKWLKTHEEFLRGQGVNLDALKDDLLTMEKLIVIRDCIVHADGDVESCRKPEIVKGAVKAIAKEHMKSGIAKAEVICVREDGNLIALDRQVIPTARIATNHILMLLFKHFDCPLGWERFF